MMPKEIHYGRLAATREEQDELAISDARKWFGPEKWELILDHLAFAKTPQDVHMLNMAMAIGGVSGLPFHALCRRYCLSAYRAWMHDGEDAVMTDEQGFALPEGKEVDA